MSKPLGGAPVCSVCQKRVYPTEIIQVDNLAFHKNCLRCKHCNKILSLGNYASMSGTYYCKPHFKQLFALKGNYDEGFGTEPHKNKWREENPNGGSAPSPASEPAPANDEPAAE